MYTKICQTNIFEIFKSQDVFEFCKQLSILCVNYFQMNLRENELIFTD